MRPNIIKNRELDMAQEKDGLKETYLLLLFIYIYIYIIGIIIVAVV